MAQQILKAGNLVRTTSTANLPQGERETLRWVIGMRYKIGVSLLAVLVVSTLFSIIPLDSAYNLLLPLLVYLLGSGVYDLASREGASTSRINIIRNIQLPEKLLLCTFAIYVSGGALTPMVLLYPLVIVEAIILADPRGVYHTGAASIVLYCTMALLEAQRAIPYVPGHWGDHDFYESASSATYAMYTLMVSTLIMVTAFFANRIALVISQRNMQVRSQLQDLRTLYDIANGLGNIMDEDEMLRYLANTLKTLQNASSCVISMVTKDDRVEVRASAGVPQGTLAKLKGISLDNPSLNPVFQRGEPLILEDIDEHSEYRPLLVNPDTRCVYLFPIKVDGKVIGSISLAFMAVTQISPEYKSLLATIANQAGVALQRAHLYGSTERLAQEMSVLYDVGLYTGSTLSRDEVLRRTAATIEKLMNPDAYYIALYDGLTDMVSFEVFTECGQQMPKMRVALNRGGLTGRIIETCKPLLVQDWQVDGQQYNSVANKTGTEMLSYLGVPMVAEDKVVGVISVQSLQPLAFDAHHERLLLALSAQTAMALENARLHQVAQDQARFDSLTKVYNHGEFVNLVRQEVEKSDRDDTCVALIMLDIDHFKQYNDTYGHVAGDNVLRMVANALKSSCTEKDYVGRWGGEEFCVLLPGAGVQEAKKIARYIRRAIAELYPVDGHGHLIPNPTISQGISSYPYPSATPSDLIEEADSALYQAKKRGRNQLIVYEGRGILKEATTTTGHLSAKMLLKDRTDKESTITTGNLSAAVPLSPAEREAVITTPRLA
ncbi:MAG: sensor domain-containing diguanylate cyclase [Chloroflexota bacterium]|nr:sensor domain-containing diguanylate cyclase [Chloroflexota bacterium]MDQ5866680.1 sensor domain-containing diguanylate cyclase [Chloroflexota bacterium]